jgi:hypothetical protein
MDVVSPQGPTNAAERSELYNGRGWLQKNADFLPMKLTILNGPGGLVGDLWTRFTVANGCYGTQKHPMDDSARI